ADKHETAGIDGCAVGRLSLARWIVAHIPGPRQLSRFLTEGDDLAIRKAGEHQTLADRDAFASRVGAAILLRLDAADPVWLRSARLVPPHGIARFCVIGINP